MKKRLAEKIIARSILDMAPYRRSTLDHALRTRPHFRTVARTTKDVQAGPARARMRLQFSDAKEMGGFRIDFDAAQKTGEGT